MRAGLRRPTLLVAFCLMVTPTAGAVEFAWQEDSAISLANGVRLFRADRQEPRLAACYLDVDLSVADLRVRPYLFSEKVTVAEATKRKGAIAAINAGYFGGNASYSHIIIEGEIKARNLASVTRDGKSYPVIRSLFYLSKERHPDVAWVYSFDNSPSGLFEFKKPLDYKPRDSTPRSVPRREQGEHLSDIAVGVGGGPTLVTDGERNVTSSQEVFWDSGVGCELRHPRTAIGYTKSRHLIMLVVDGRQPKKSVGVSLQELADVMKDLDCVEAMNLDGGGSTQMATPAGNINSPSEQRPVPSILAVERNHR